MEDISIICVEAKLMRQNEGFLDGYVFKTNRNALKCTKSFAGYLECKAVSFECSAESIANLPRDS